jgi:hypothetical protein
MRDRIVRVDSIIAELARWPHFGVTVGSALAVAKWSMRRDDYPWQKPCGKLPAKQRAWPDRSPMTVDLAAAEFRDEATKSCSVAQVGRKQVMNLWQ